MATRKAERQVDVTIEYKGATYSGYRIISGTANLFQTVFYKSLSKSDGHSYRPDETVYMTGIAEIILRELVDEDLSRKGA